MMVVGPGCAVRHRGGRGEQREGHDWLPEADVERGRQAVGARGVEVKGVAWVELLLPDAGVWVEKE